MQRLVVISMHQAFESYEKEQSYNAPVGKYAMFAYTTALNYLLTQSKYVKLLGDTTVVYWSEDADIECKDLFLQQASQRLTIKSYWMEYFQIWKRDMQ